MIVFYKKGPAEVTAVEIDHAPTAADDLALSWLLGGAVRLKSARMKGTFVGPRREMVTPWSTNAVEIIRNMGVEGVSRIERFRRSISSTPVHDRMLERVYSWLDGEVFSNDREPAPIRHIADIHAYNIEEGLALSPEEEAYLNELSRRMGRQLTDSEVFGFSQVNSEHCRHKIFNGSFVIDGEVMPLSLFKMIKLTSERTPGRLVSAYKDNVAFVSGPEVETFCPERPDEPSLFTTGKARTVLSLKAETHNFPTTVEPFNGAATGSGGEIRDRMGGGRSSLPLAGTAVYMTSYPRNGAKLRPFEKMTGLRKWLYQTPEEILIKASNGASDFCNKFGQPLICGSLLTFEHTEKNEVWAYDKVIMLAGGVGYAFERDAIKGVPEPGQPIVLLGGDNYRIGMGGGAVSSVNTGAYGNAIELNAVQRANPEMQKRVSNVVRALAESEDNPIVSIHDHGAGGHLNALSELVEATGGVINLDALPVGDPTLSDKEIIGNESQERMGLVAQANPAALERIERISARERAPMYVIGHTTEDHRFVFARANGNKPIDLLMDDMLGSTPRTVINDHTVSRTFRAPHPDSARIEEYLLDVLSLEAVGSKDWLTNKADRSVTGRVARQQCQGPLQLPLSDCGVVALDYTGTAGIATSIGHAPQAALIDSAAASRLAIIEALTNIAGAPLAGGLDAVSLSANWMWPCKNKGEDAALYRAVKACSDYAIGLGINIPTGKDSLSMTQKYSDGSSVKAPGTVIISAAGEVTDVKLTVSPVLRSDVAASSILYVPLATGFGLGGSALAQTMGIVGGELPEPLEPAKVRATFNAVQQLVANNLVLAMHDVSAGGLVVTLLEMCFSNPGQGMKVNLTPLGAPDAATALFCERPALVMQIADEDVADTLLALPGAMVIGRPMPGRNLDVVVGNTPCNFNIPRMLKAWYAPSALLDEKQSGARCAHARAINFCRQPVRWTMPESFKGEGNTPVKEDAPLAAIIREKGINGDREMAWALHAAGFRVKDVHMTDLTSGRETLEDVRMLVFCGGFSNSDVAGSAKGWAGAIKFNAKASEAIRRFYERDNTMSLGVCNGCQLMMELNLLNGGDNAPRPGRMEHNRSGKFESIFLSVAVSPDTPSIMLKPLRGAELGVWVAHGEGRFVIDSENCPDSVRAARYSYAKYPGNPNGSDDNLASLCSADGRHLAIMPHPERAIYPWQCGYYPAGRAADRSTPWLEAFKAARQWIEQNP